MVTFTSHDSCQAGFDHVLPAAPRLAEARSLVDQGAYFVLHAPMRTGKTTALRALATEITSEGRFAAILCSAKVAAPACSDLVLVQDALLSALRIAAQQDLPEELRPPTFSEFSVATRLWEGLSEWARVCPRPIVIFFDDFDSLHDAALESVLRQLETGFSRRPGHFPWSVGLACQSDLRYVRSSRSEQAIRTISTGPFEYFWSSRLLPPFTLEETRALYTQMFGDLAHRFTSESLTCIHEASAGQPFFVHTLGRDLSELVRSEEKITKLHVVHACDRLARQFHSPISDLASLLIQPNVRAVIEPLLAGNMAIAAVANADLAFVRDIGLVSMDDPVRIEGTIHRTMITRILAMPVMRTVNEDASTCFDGNGRLYMDALLQAFGSFYANHAIDLISAIAYSRVAQELVFLGFLFRMLDGRAAVEVDYGTAHGRIEVTISVPLSNEAVETSDETKTAEQREVIVLVTRRKNHSGVKSRGLEWLDDALRATGSDSGTLIVFDKRDKRAPGKRVKLKETATAQGKTVRSLRV